MKILKEYEAEELLKKEGFNIVERDIAENKEQAIKKAEKIGYPVVLKNIELLHKSDKNGVRLNIYKENLEKNFKELKSKKVLIQKQEKGSEFLIGIKKDDVFGHVIMFGIGGIYTELLNDISLRVYPISKKDAKDMVDDIKYNKIFNFRNVKLNKKVIINNLLKINSLVKKYPKIKELDINPLILNEKEGVIADARIIFE